MLNLLLTLACLAQDHHPGDGHGLAGLGGASAVPLVVRGTVELSAGEADAAASALLGDRARVLLSERGRSLMAQLAPVWLPEFSREQTLARWLTAIEPEGALRVIDRERAEHDHGHLGTSYRTALIVEADREQLGKHMSRLRRQIPRAADTFALKCAGIAGFWTVLALAISWLDRLSRGYMTWRLRFLGLIAGSAAPALLLFLV